MSSVSDTCAHCELPLPRRFASATIGGEASRFCCYGCVLAQQVTRAKGEPGAAAAILIRLGLAVFCTMNVMALSLPTYGAHVYGSDAIPADGPLLQLLRVLSAVFAMPVLLLLGGPVIAAARKGVRSGALTADVLIVLGAAAAYGLSLTHVLRGAGEVYFDTAAMLLVIVTIGRYLEAKAKADASSLVKATFVPESAQARRFVKTGVEAVSADTLEPGDLVRVVPGESFPTDGIVLRGDGSVDEAALTGESSPVRKDAGAPVAGGTCSIDGTFAVLVSARRSGSATARIAALLTEALRQRGETERLVDRAAQAFVPLIVVVALLTGVAWSVIAGVDHGLLNGLSVLVVACPCALGIATPVALWMGLLRAARNGVIVRNAAVLERAARIDRVLFDKTGTLTGRLPVLEGIAIAPGRSWQAGQALGAAAALEAHLRHPVAEAITAAAGCGGVGQEAAGDIEVIPGKGVHGVVGGRRLTIGSVEFAAARLSAAALDALRGDAGPATTILWDDDGALASFSFSEQPRVSARPAIDELRRLGIGTGLLSGDRYLGAVVPALLSAEEALGGLTAAAKLQRIHDDRRHGAVAMVGDGLNDAPALAAADVGIAIGAPVDLTRVSADVLVLGEDLRKVPWLLQHARRVRRVMVQNIAWAGGYNAVAVTLAVLGKLTPLAAALVMVFSSVLVVANSRRLLSRSGTGIGDGQTPLQPREPAALVFPDLRNASRQLRPTSASVQRHVP